MDTQLKGRQLKFAIEYVICGNQTQAARLAGYNGDEVALCVTGNRLLKNAKVLAYIDKQMEAYAMPAHEVLMHLTDIARGDIADSLNQFGGIDPLEAKRRGKSHLIKRFKTKDTTITEKDGTERHIIEDEIEMHDRQKALDTLAKYHALLVDRIEIDWRLEFRQAGLDPDRIEKELVEKYLTGSATSATQKRLDAGEDDIDLTIEPPDFIPVAERDSDESSEV